MTADEMKPINTEFVLALYRKHYPKEYAASIAAYGEPKPTADKEPPQERRDPEAVAKAKKKIAAEIGKRRKETHNDRPDQSPRQ